MVQDSIKPSLDQLMRFLELAGERNLMKKATAGAYKKASSTILGVLDEAEAADLSIIDLDSVFARHRNKATGRMTPVTLKSYETRTHAALDNFLDYFKNPTSWKPKVQPRTRKTAAPSQPARKAGAGTGAGKAGKQEEGEEPHSRPSVHIDLQIHISPEASPEQVDQVFASMRRHLYGNVGVTK